MELKQLYYFAAVIKEGTISGAARRLNLSQPPLSTQMKQLEEEFGCILFERGSRKIQLTEAGQLLYDRALTLLELSELTAKELKDYRNGSSGSLRLGVVSSVGSTLLSGWIRSFHEKSPSIRFELSEANTYQLLEQLHSNLIELAIVRTPFNADGFECANLLEEPMLAVGHARFFNCGSGDASEAGGAISVEALGLMPLIIYRRWEDYLLGIFEEYGVSPYLFCLNDDARTSAYWADAGLGVGIIPASTKSLLSHPETVTKKIDDGRLLSSIAVIHNRNGYMSTIARLFLEHLLSYHTTT